MRKILTILAPLLIVSGVGFMLYQSAGKTRAAEARSLREREELNEMKREMGALRGELRTTTLHTQLVDLAIRRGDPVSDAAPSSSAAEPAAPSTPEEDHERTEAFIAQIAQSFQAEAADRQWSGKVEAEISAALNNDHVKLNAKSVECRSKTCRLELEGNEPGAQMKGLPLVANHLAATLPSTMGHEESDGHGGTHMVLYLYGNGS